jgi:hypothetical protein
MPISDEKMTILPRKVDQAYAVWHSEIGKIIAVSGDYILVADNRNRLAIKSRKVYDFSVVEHNIPGFSPSDHKILLKKAGWGKVEDHAILRYGRCKNLDLYTFCLKGHLNNKKRLWLTRYAFWRALDWKKDDGKRFTEAASKNTHPAEVGRDDWDEDMNEDEAQKNYHQQRKPNSNMKHHSGASENTSAVLSNDDDDNSHAAGSLADSDDSGADSHGETSHAVRPIYANIYGHKVWVLEKSNIYDTHILDTRPRKAMCTGSKVERAFAPAADIEFIKKMFTFEFLECYRLEGCVPIYCGDEEPLKVLKFAVVHFTDPGVRFRLIKHRRSLGCDYRGPALISIADFQRDVCNNRDAMARANELYEQTTLARKWAQEEDRKARRHKTLANDSKVLQDGLKTIEEYLKEMDRLLQQTRRSVRRHDRSSQLDQVVAACSIAIRLQVRRVHSFSTVFDLLWFP